MTGAGPVRGAGVFISYRREDAASAAGWLFERLACQFGRGRVFKDVDSIRPGADFTAEIMTAIGSSAVLLAVIGQQWLTAAGPGGRRLEEPGDLVRLEIEEALARGVRVVPVLVDRAHMPSAAELPASLAGLAQLQAVELDPDRFIADADHLVRVLKPVLREAPRRRTLPDPLLFAVADGAAAPATRRKMSRTARGAITVTGAVAILAAVGVIVAMVQLPQRGQASPPVCNPPPRGLGAQQIYCDDFRSDANDWEDPNAPSSGDGVYRLGAYSLKAAAGGDVQVGVPQQAGLGLDASVNVLVSVLATAAPAPGAQYGLTCRGGPDDQLHLQGKGYAFVIAGSIAVIEKVEFRGGPTQVSRLAASRHPLPVRHGASLLQASCETRAVGAKTAVLLRFWVNGEQVASYEDLATPFTRGYVGVVCLTNGSAPQPVTATFERFGVYSVQAPPTATPSPADGTRPGQSSHPATRTSAAAAGTSPAPLTVPATVYASQLQPAPVQNLTITQGDLVTITVISGLWQCADQTGKTSIGGSPAYDKVATNRQWAVPSAPFCSLIARIGGGPWLGLAPTFQFVAENSGSLELTANDLMPANCPQPPARTSCYTDNWGAITVRITVSAG